jgi:5,6-dimethylbenzimidazole synthase
MQARNADPMTDRAEPAPESLSAPCFGADFQAELTTLLSWRRDTRRFRRDPLPEGLIDELLALAQKAPSVGNSQPWRFVRVRTPALRAALADHVDAEAAKAGEAYEAPRRAAYTSLKLHGLEDAPEVLAVYCDDGTAAGSGLGAATMPEARAYSVVLAIYSLWLAARARGLSVGWVSILRPEFVVELLATPPEWRLVALLCIGFPESQSDTPELERLGWQGRQPWQDNVSER